MKRTLLLLACYFFIIPAATRAEVNVKSTEGNPLIQIKQESGNLESFVTLSGKQLALSAHTKDDGKRIYKVNGREIEVKPGDDGFKLKDSNGKLLWKIKQKENKLKISDNEENAHPFELKWKAPDRIGVEREDAQLGKVVFDAVNGQVTVEDSGGAKIFQGKYPKLCGFFAIILLNAISTEERAIILTELALKEL